MRKLLLAALLGGCAAMPANAVVSIGAVAALEYTFSYRSDDHGGDWVEESRGHVGGTITFVADSWNSVFDTTGIGPFLGCFDRGSPCINASILGNKLTFSGEDLQSYDRFHLTLIFDRNIETDYSAIIPENFISGSFSYAAGGHSFGSSLYGPVLSLAFSEPGIGPAPVNAVPEPATWALMIGGFALAGSAMRRRKVAVSFT